MKAVACAVRTTFKYFYLLFAPPQTLDPGKFVLNTKAHPIRPTWRDR